MSTIDELEAILSSLEYPPLKAKTHHFYLVISILISCLPHFTPIPFSTYEAPCKLNHTQVVTEPTRTSGDLSPQIDHVIYLILRSCVHAVLPHLTTCSSDHNCLLVHLIWFIPHPVNTYGLIKGQILLQLLISYKILPVTTHAPA